ncbi:preprotein translocase subunit SecE [Buchnera aphidicola (Ceratoglyphina bambusae)]|uniref:preprotein translocase subunit SecE n=1 Tax=Buchnera aphidicola TaxID=9 RepID=UPI0031B80A35
MFFLIIEILLFFNFFKKNNIVKQIISLISLSLTLLLLIKYTKYGTNFLKFIKEISIELKKIEWPKKIEIFYISITIILVSTIISIILWIIDNLLFYAISNIITMRL